LLFWLAAPDRPWALAVLGIAAATDLVDGSVARAARRRGAIRWADTGEWLDPMCDKLFAVTVLTALAVRFDVAIGILALIGARELILGPIVVAYRVSPLRRRYRPDFHAARAGKAATTAQFVAVLAILLDLPGAVVLLLAVIAAALGLYAAARYLYRAAHGLRSRHRTREPGRERGLGSGARPRRPRRSRGT
jgi:phosphatidylglycerophosphate synthase